MALLARARELEAQGRSVIHMEIGEPDFVTPDPVVQAGIRALQQGKTRYTPATGLPALRSALANYYRKTFGVSIDPCRIVITTGASGALLLLMALLVEEDSEVMMADPGYPCNRNFVRLYGGKPVDIPVGPEQGYQLDAGQLESYWSSSCNLVLLASPSNPTGTCISQAQLELLLSQVHDHQAALIVDEIYQGLTYDGRPTTALSLGDELFVVNSFSKYFGMTGWRLGWLVAPQRYVDDLDKLAQNLFLAAPTPSQYAALAAFDDVTLAILEQRRQEFRCRRDYLLPALQSLGFDIRVKPQGAFYLYAGCSHLCSDSFQFATDLLEQAGVAVTPGIDFGSNQAAQHVRFAYTTHLDNLQEGVARIKEFVS